MRSSFHGNRLGVNRLRLGFAPVGLALIGLACASAGGGRLPNHPVIESIEPGSGPVGMAYPIEIVLRGRGFADRGNAIRFGDLTLTDIPSTQGGTRIAFMAPKQRGTGSEAPPMALQPGRYLVTVSTLLGTSEPVTFELVRDAEDAAE